jgi:CO/xanthine dehydrogenase Mo-binding subunit
MDNLMFPEMPNTPQVRDKYIPETFNVVGKVVRRTDGERKAGGTALYTTDISFPGMLYACGYASPYASAKIKSMDTSEAEKMPGVRAVLRYDDPEFGNGKTVMSAFFFSTPIVPQTTFFFGEQMGVWICADTEDIAQEALTKVKIEWEERTPVLDIMEALDPSSPIFHPEHQQPFYMPPGEVTSNITGGDEGMKLGDVEQGFKESKHVIEFDYKRNIHGCCNAEPMVGISQWQGECLELWVHHQYPYSFKWVMHNLFGIDENKVRVNSPFGGGSFGGFSACEVGSIYQAVSAIFAKRTGKPVKAITRRRDEVAVIAVNDSGHYHFKVGFNDDGKIIAVWSRSYFEHTATVNPLSHLLENTSIPNLDCQRVHVGRNKGYTGPYRCEQQPGTAAMALVFARVAAELGMDPTKVALINDGADGKGMDYLANYKQERGFDPDRDSLKECLEVGKAAIGWDDKWHEPGTKQLSNGKMHGMGFVWDHEWDSTRGAGAAGVFIQQDGTANIVTTRCDNGVNAESSYAQIVAEHLGVKYEDVFMRAQEDNQLYSMTPDGSCNLCTNGYVVRKAAKRCKQKLLEMAVTDYDIDGEGLLPACFPGLKATDLDVKDGWVYEIANPDNRMTVKDVVTDNMGYQFPAPDRMMQTSVKGPVYAWAFHRQGRFGAEYWSHRLCRQAHFWEVEVDTETGEIEVKKVVNTNDVGKVINWGGALGQQYGGTYMGVGRNRQEEYIYDQSTGVLLNGNLYEYKWATIKDVGPIECHLIETGLGFGPYGACGIGENVGTVTQFGLTSAVYNAIGKWILEDPITPDKVLKALGKA